MHHNYFNVYIALTDMYTHVFYIQYDASVYYSFSNQLRQLQQKKRKWMSELLVARDIGMWPLWIQLEEIFLVYIVYVEHLQTQCWRL